MWYRVPAGTQVTTNGSPWAVNQPFEIPKCLICPKKEIWCIYQIFLFFQMLCSTITLAIHVFSWPWEQKQAHCHFHSTCLHKLKIHLLLMLHTKNDCRTNYTGQSNILPANWVGYYLNMCRLKVVSVRTPFWHRFCPTKQPIIKAYFQFMFSSYV